MTKPLLQDKSALAGLALAAISIAGTVLFVAIDNRTGQPSRVLGSRGEKFVEVRDAIPPDIGKRLKVHGFVVYDSRTSYGFDLMGDGAILGVQFRGPYPDTFRDGAEVVVSGTLREASDGGLELAATEVSAKCPESYDTPDGPVPAARFK